MSETRAFKSWSHDELAFLQDHWGTYSIKRIASELGRTVQAVKLKANRIGLQDNRVCLDGITLNQLAVTLNISYSIARNWHLKYGLPARKRILSESRPCRVIDYDDFWKWAEAHKHLLNFARMEPGMLGKEPDWMAEKRKADVLNTGKETERRWTKDDDAKLRAMLQAYRYTYSDIAKSLKRTESAVKRRLFDLKIKLRPIYRDNHIKYTKEEVRTLLDFYNRGYGYNSIAEKLGKSEIGIRGKLERMGHKFPRSQAKSI